MSNKKVTFSLNEDVVNKLRIISAASSTEQSKLVEIALERLFDALRDNLDFEVHSFSEIMVKLATVGDSLNEMLSEKKPGSKLPGD